MKYRHGATSAVLDDTVVTLIPSLLMFPLLVGQLLIVVLLYRFWRHSFWWWMLGGIVFTLAAFCLQASSFSLSLVSNPVRYFPVVYPYVLIDAWSNVYAWVGLLLSTVGFGLSGILLGKQRQRIENLELIATAQTTELQKTGAR